MPRSVLMWVKHSEQIPEPGDGDICDVWWRGGRVPAQVEEAGRASAGRPEEGGVTEATYAAAHAHDMD